MLYLPTSKMTDGRRLIHHSTTSQRHNDVRVIRCLLLVNRSHEKNMKSESKIGRGSDDIMSAHSWTELTLQTSIQALDRLIHDLLPIHPLTDKYWRYPPETSTGI
jgi:hypothetical protein